MKHHWYQFHRSFFEQEQEKFWCFNHYKSLHDVLLNDISRWNSDVKLFFNINENWISWGVDIYLELNDRWFLIIIQVIKLFFSPYVNEDPSEKKTFFFHIKQNLAELISFTYHSSVVLVNHPASRKWIYILIDVILVWTQYTF